MPRPDPKGPDSKERLSMNLDITPLLERRDAIVTLDLHAAGEPLRLIVGGLPSLPGRTMEEKRRYAMDRLDHVRLLLTREPRGHRDMFAAIATEPVTPDGSMGLLFMDARRYPYMCGHGVIASVTAFVEMGWLTPPEGGVVVVDTPAGSVRTRPRVVLRQEGRPKVASVAVELEPAFVYERDREVVLEDGRRLRVDVCFAGGFFVMVSAEQTGIPLSPERAPELSRLGMALIEAANRQLRVQHPVRDYIRTVDVTAFYDPSEHDQFRGRGFVVLGEGHVDRSPCGTGTSAKLALLHRTGALCEGRVFENRGLTGTTFKGRIVRETEVGTLPAVVPEIEGPAWITGLHRFVVDPEDPFPEGFLI